jgi:hypothetical protein
VQSNHQVFERRLPSRKASSALDENSHPNDLLDHHLSNSGRAKKKWRGQDSEFSRLKSVSQRGHFARA